MARALLLSLLLVGGLLSGCLGSDEGTAGETVRKNRAEVTESTGGIEGTVTDAAVQPVVGATVTLTGTGKTARTASDGSYAFSQVLPGTYSLTLEAEGFVGAEQEVVVRSNRASVVDVILAHVPSVIPYFQQQEFTGFVECSLATPVFLIAVCGAVNSFAGGNATNDRFLFTWDVAPEPWQIVFEVHFETSSAVGDLLSATVEPIDIPNEDHTEFGSARGTSPLIVNIDRETLVSVDNNMTAICNGELEPSGPAGIYPENPDTYCRPSLIEEGGTLWARLFSRGSSATPVALGAAVQQEYHVIVTMFHHAPACEDYSVFNGNLCPQEEAARNGTAEG